jgi:hypothetical protein
MLLISCVVTPETPSTSAFAVSLLALCWGDVFTQEKKCPRIVDVCAASFYSAGVVTHDHRIGSNFI